MFILRGSPGGSRVLRFGNRYGPETATPHPLPTQQSRHQCHSEVSSGEREGHRKVRMDESQLREALSLRDDGGRAVEGCVRGGGLGCPHHMSG